MSELKYIRREGDKPVACHKCNQKYWACPVCGGSPMWGNELSPPEKCRNPYCKNTEFVFKTTVICCQRYTHHLGSRCKHCGVIG